MRARGEWGLLLLLTPLLWGFDPFRSSNGQVEEGNAKLGAGKVKEALAHYERAAKELPEEPGVQYNLGIAHYQLGQFDKAREALTRATAAQDPQLRARAHYNLGNAQFELKKYKEAAGAYTRALQLRPGHGPAKWNLELALRRLREEEKKKQQQKKDQKQDQKKDQKQDQKQGQKQEQKQDQKQRQGQKPPRPDEKGPKQKQEPKRGQRDQPKPEKAQDREMNRVLDALDRGDRKQQRQRVRRLGGNVSRPVKDW